MCGERVLVCGVDGYAYCLSAVDGEIVWKKRTRGRIRGSAVSGDGGFLVPSYDGYLYSLSAVLGRFCGGWLSGDRYRPVRPRGRDGW